MQLAMRLAVIWSANSAVLQLERLELLSSYTRFQRLVEIWGVLSKVMRIDVLTVVHSYRSLRRAFGIGVDGVVVGARNGAYHLKTTEN